MFTDIPGTEVMGVFMAKLTGADRGSKPVRWRTGYVYANKLKSSPDRDRTMKHRWVNDLDYRLPIGARMDLEASWRTWYDGDFENNLRVGFRYGVGPQNRLSVAVGYQRGSLPPLFNFSEAAFLELSLELY